MRVLMVTPLIDRCGEAEYGKIWARELRAAGVDVVEWDGAWPAVYHRGHRYLPEDLSGFDIIHVNWGPANMGHYLPDHFPVGKPLSLFLHDVPPNSSTTLVEHANLVMAFEPAEIADLEVIDHAVPTYYPEIVVRDAQRIVIGVTGLRDDPGMKMVAEVCRERGWHLNAPGIHWLSTEEEIDRLARSTVNVCWYQTSGRGKSMAAMFCCAARRPLLLSGSSMFSALWPYQDEISISHDSSYEELRFSLDLIINADILDLISNSAILGPIPNRVCTELSWSRCAAKIKRLWEEIA